MDKSIVIRERFLGVIVVLFIQSFFSSAIAVEFNTDVLDAEDRNNIDLSRFSQAGYVMPGRYRLELVLNGKKISEQEIIFREKSQYSPNEKPRVETCLTQEQIALLGLKVSALEKVKFDTQGLCADFSALEGVVLRGDLGTSALYITIPQAWLEYQDESWLPPSRWEEGIPGILLDYSINAINQRPVHGHQTQSVSSNGTAGANAGAWRLRGDWQGNYDHTTGEANSTQRNFDWTRIYAFRALPNLMAKMTVGEDYLSSDLFDSWRYTGLSLVSDESQLPPKLRGYAPEVSGIAKTNAKVTVSQQGRIVYETTVPAGPFRIQDLGSAINGTLDVRIEEQDGSVQTFQTTMSSIPYLTRAGQVRYKLAVGRPSDYGRHIDGSLFGTAEISWGLSNTWSLYGGGIFSSDYNSIAIGLGRDLYHFGAISADITQSIARLPQDDTLQGRAYRVSYSKHFDEFNSDVTFAGYRFAERDYISMSDFLSYRNYNNAYGKRGNHRDLYTVTASKSFTDMRLTAYLNWSHETYWDKADNDRYSLSLNRYFDIGRLVNTSLSLSASRSEYEGKKDDAIWLSLNIPFGRGAISYNGNLNNGDFSQNASWYQRLENNDSYRLSAGTASGNGEHLTAQGTGLYNHYGSSGDVTANIGWRESAYTSLGLSVNGGITATGRGVALHGSSFRGGTRMMVSTDGVADIPVGRNGKTNIFGIAVEPSVPSYYRTSTRIDVNRLSDDVEMGGSPVAEAALTEGAIGYRRFNVLKGSKLVAIIALSDGSHPPFGASVRDEKGRELGMVSEGGLAWISGVSPGQHLSLHWEGKPQCNVSLPANLDMKQVLLPCQATKD
ncbi:fimbria/pilus outer membrane usher protein [Enterobacter sp. Cy-643]|uniref:fimbria/pilus outer membrane usher protein n=1 Tax=Enterobacter sp. Cy-643 TaxID=2608346 RepID=UPI001420F2D4|nr:fimbria/pilus outer membrane usher protein [Enterobacter sp. Cy-643]NIF33019.1 fimbria/pilus outer membrane usher protein [Enterobacter sp. Cy-643]